MLHAAHALPQRLRQARGQLVLGSAYLLVDVANGLLALAVHVEDLQESLVHPLVARKAGLHRQRSLASSQRACGYLALTSA